MDTETNIRAQAVVNDWLAGEYTMFDACVEEPEIAWVAVIQISQLELNDEQKSLLSAGPLETLLAWHGRDFIDRIVEEARRNSIFRQLLGGVWRRDIPEDIWQSIEKARTAI